MLLREWESTHPDGMRVNVTATTRREVVKRLWKMSLAPAFVGYAR